MSKAPFLIQRRRTHYAFRLYAVREELGALVRKMEVSEEGGGRAGGRAGGRREGRRLKARYAPFSVDRVRVLIAKQRVDASTRSGLGRPTFLVALDRPIPCLTPPPPPPPLPLVRPTRAHAVLSCPSRRTLTDPLVSVSSHSPCSFHRTVPGPSRALVPTSVSLSSRSLSVPSRVRFAVPFPAFRVPSHSPMCHRFTPVSIYARLQVRCAFF